MQPDSESSSRSQFGFGGRSWVALKAPYFFVCALVSLSLLFFRERPQCIDIATAVIAGLVSFILMPRVPREDRIYFAVAVYFGPQIFVVCTRAAEIDYFCTFLAVVSGL